MADRPTDENAPSAEEESIPRSAKKRVSGTESGSRENEEQCPSAPEESSQRRDILLRKQSERGATPESRLGEAEKQINIVQDKLQKQLRMARAWEEFISALKLGMSPTQAADYVGVEVMGYRQSDWAEVRGVSRQTVHTHLCRSRDRIEELRDEWPSE